MPINTQVTIKDGCLKGRHGIVVEHFSIEDEVEIQIDDITSVTINTKYIKKGWN